MANELDHLRVVLVRTRNPLNLGAAARAMSNFGALHLRVVNPYDVAFREARSAVGAAPLLARAEEFQSVADAVADCALVVGTTAGSHRDLHNPLRRLEEGARLIRRQLESSRVALLFGSEKVGLSNADFGHCDWLLRIPAREEHPSMNLGQAVAVCLYELLRSEPLAGIVSAVPSGASAEERENLTQLLFTVLRASGYIKPRMARAQEEKLRRLVHRMHLDKRDATLWLGMLRQIAWKLKERDAAG